MAPRQSEFKVYRLRLWVEGFRVYGSGVTRGSKRRPIVSFMKGS